MAQLVPYLTFNGNCREAMEFYRQCLGGKIEMMTVGDSPMASRMPKEQHGRVLHSVLVAEDFVLMAADMMENEKLIQGNTVTLTLTCRSEEELTRFFSSLSEDGRIGHPLSEEFFGTIGDVIDKYGFRWTTVMMKQMQTAA